MGNHDDDYVDEWKARWDYSNNELWYSVDRAGIHFTVLKVPDLELLSDYGPETEQYAWLVKDLRSASYDNEVRFKCVFMHSPFYADSDIKPIYERDSILVPLFDEYNVDVVFAGHHHNYQRTKRIRNNAVDIDGTLYIETSGGGGIPREPHPKWFTETCAISYHFTQVDLRGNMLHFNIINIDNNIIDSFVLPSRYNDPIRVHFGRSDDHPAPSDYDGDGADDIAIYRPSSGLWAVKGVTRGYFGSGSDQPVPGDYRGDGKDNIGIFRPSSGLWAVRGISWAYFGREGDIPVTR